MLLESRAGALLADEPAQQADGDFHHKGTKALRNSADLADVLIPVVYFVSW